MCNESLLISQVERQDKKQAKREIKSNYRNPYRLTAMLDHSIGLKYGNKGIGLV